MGVYIKGMEMPEHCGVCRFAVDGWCYAYGKPNIDALANDGRTNFCPLVPVPPHGRLIDAGKLEELCNIMAEKCDGIGTSIWEQFRTTVEWCHTIIPADKEARE